MNTTPTPAVPAKTTPPAKTSTAITPVVKFKINLSKEMKTITNFVGEKNQQKFISSCVACFQNVPKLADCQPASLMNAFLEAARLQLYPSNSLGESYILPYGDKAQFQIGYKGFITLFWRSGVSAITSQVVYQNDEFSYELGLEPILRHIPADGARGEATHAYAIAKIKGEKIFRVMSKSDIMKIKATSKAAKSSFSPWNGNDPELWMWQKTVIKQLAKLLPKTELMARAINVDNTCERGGYFSEKRGEIIDVPFEESEKESANKEQEEKNRAEAKKLLNDK